MCLHGRWAASCACYRCDDCSQLLMQHPDQLLVRRHLEQMMLKCLGDKVTAWTCTCVCLHRRRVLHAVAISCGWWDDHTVLHTREAFLSSSAGRRRKEGNLHTAGMCCRNAEWWSGIELSFCSLVLLNGCISSSKHVGAHVFEINIVTSALFWAT